MKILKYSRIITACFLVSVTFFMTAQNKITEPDFAFPKKVSANAEAALKTAIKTSDGNMVIRSLIDYALAQSAVSNDNLPDVMQRIDEIRIKEQNPCTKAILDILMARIYLNIYEADKYKYDTRSLPLMPVPQDYNLWSGEQFRHVISGMCSSSVINSAALQLSQLSSYKEIIDASRETLIYYPTLYDFIANESIAIRKRLSPFANVFPIVVLSPARTFIVSPRFVPSSDEAKRILDLYAELLKFHADDTAPYIMTDLDRIKFITTGIYRTQKEPAQKRAEELLTELFDRFSDTQYSGDILLALAKDMSYDEKAGTRQLYPRLKKFAARYPSYYRIGCIKNYISNIEAASVNIEASGIVSPGHATEIKISAVNVNEVSVGIYRVPDNASPFENGYIPDLSRLSKISEQKINFNGTVPFDADTTISVILPGYGNYIAVPRSKSITESGRRNYTKIHCTDLAIGSASFRSDRIFVVNPFTGAPVENADVKYQERVNRNYVEKKFGTTGSDGFVSGNNTVTGGNFMAVKGADKFSMPTWIWFSQREESLATAVYANTDLPLYHPGDTVRWAGVAYSYIGDSHRLLSGKKISAVLYNANYMPVDTIETVSDDFGRIEGLFTLPSDELTGRYHIGFDNSSVYFMVSDYKLPSYYLEVTAVNHGVPESGDITLSGKARTYSGVSMSDMPVTMTLSASELSFWFRSNDVTFYSDTVTTDANGDFNIVISRELIANSPAPDGLFTARLTATSASGENQSVTKTFTDGSAYRIEATIPGNIDITRPVNLNIRVTDGEDKSIATPVMCEVYSSDDINKLQKKLIAPSPTLDFGNLSSGVYSIKLYTTDVKSDTLTIDKICLYRPSDKKSPANTPLWTPADNNTVSSDNDGKYKLLYATTAKESHILYTLSDTSRIIEQRWIKQPAGMHRMDIKLPSDCKSATVTMMSVMDYKSSIIEVTVKRPDADRHFMLIAESFRDKVIPNEEETWTFRTLDKDSTGQAAAIILSMYNSALDALATQSRTFNPFTGYVPRFNIDAPQTGYSTYYHLSSRIKQLRCDDMMPPQLNTYGRSFYTPKKLLMRNMMYKSAANVDASVTMSEDMVADGLAGAAPGLGVTDNGGNMLTKVSEHSETLYLESEDNDESGPASGKDGSTSDFQYRDNAATLAFFRPMLTSDADGRLSFTFRVPDANTTWAFSAIAYNQDVETAQFASQVLANKPIMVQPNMPRFLRSGDKARVEALVFNNSDQACDIKVSTQLFDPADNRVILTHDTTVVNVPASSRITTAIEISAPDTMPFIGYRIKASTDRFSDGEQSLIPILSSISPVMDTYPFYIAPDSTDFSMRLPKLGENSIVTLQYCDNPIWYVVTALPGISTSEMTTATQAAEAIFSAGVATGIIDRYPAIRQALDEWISGDKSDSTLVSMLQRNSDLKNMLLQATPWLLDARNETERMQRLALLLDRKNIAEIYDKAIGQLSKLQRNSGGWAWIGQSDEASEWATGSVLTLLGRLNQMGFLPNDSDLNKMTGQALAFHQHCVEKNYRRYPNEDYSYYVQIRDLWPQYKPSTTGNTIIASTVQKILSKWKKMNIDGKAKAAILLHNHGYAKSARTILASLDEYAQSSPTQGLWWPSVGDTDGGSMTQLLTSANALLAYHTVSPGAKQIDMIRQWLIMQKETRNWGTSSTTNEVIAAILLTSPSWIHNASDVTVTIGTTPVSVSYSDNQLGYFRTDISRYDISGQMLEIHRVSDSPAWGAVYCRSRQIMTAIAPASCEAISVEKKFLRQAGDKWEPATKFNVGDLIKVQLIIKANRDLEYITVNDERAACFEPVEQMPEPIYSEGVCFYRENRDASTNMFVTSMPKGTYVLTYDVWVNNSGTYSSGIASVQSQYSPQISAHSGGNTIESDR